MSIVSTSRLFGDCVGQRQRRDVLPCRSKLCHRCTLESRRSLPGVSTGASPSLLRAHQSAKEEQSETFQNTRDATVSQLMTKEVVTVHLDDSMKQVAETFLDKKISGAPVVDSADKVVGILSEGDILWKAAGAEDNYIIPPMYLAFADAYICLRNNKRLSEESEKVLATKAKEAMSHHPITASPGMLVSEAAALLLKKQIRMLPVVESDGKLLGVITRSDIIRGMVADSKPYLLV